MSSLPPWGTAELPEPRPLSVRNALHTIGPGAILLAASIGGGEWLVGPAVAVQHGRGVFWIATVGILLQLLFNLEAIRYTLYTGEPILTGILRLKPGHRVWGPLYVVLTAAQLGVPALAVGCAPVLFAAACGQLPGAPDRWTLLGITYGVILLGLVLLSFGGTVERMLERLSWGMIAYIFAFLLYINIICVPVAHSWTTARGFFQFGYVPSGMDLLLLASLATTAGSGGIGNLTVSNWARDKGLGMGARVGAIGSAFGGEHVQLEHVGKVFPITSSNLQRWRTWWQYVTIDQVYLWGIGCFLGMFLNVNLATAIMPPGKNITGVAAGAFQAEFLAQQYWSGLWYLGLLNGFWILFSTHLGNTDVMVRTITDTLWVASRRIRAWQGGRISRLYYTLLLVLTVPGVIAVHFGSTMDLFKILGTLAGLVLALAGVQVWRVNTTLLPPELRPAWWRQLALGLCSAFYGFLTLLVAWHELPKLWHG